MNKGFTFLKMDLGVRLVERTPGTVTRPLGDPPGFNVQHMFTGIEVTDKGIAMMADYVGAVRDVIGMEVPPATGIPKPIVDKGYIRVPEGPGLGVELNDEVVQQHLLEPGYFEPTPQWDKDRSNDRLWS